MSIRPLLTLAVVAVCANSAGAAVKTEPVEYREGQAVLEGYLAYDDALKDARPLVLVVHEWRGLDDYAKSRARQLAELGYVAFAVDMYGKGVLAKDNAEARMLAGRVRGDLQLLRRRIKAGLDAVRGNARVDGKRIAAIGYCFGGTVALELARSGADIAGVVSFHGGLATTQPAQADTLKAKILVCTGADDRSVPMSQVDTFIQEMRTAKANYQINIYGNAVHAFTNPANDRDPSDNSAYNEPADRRSWQAMREFFEELFRQQ